LQSGGSLIQSVFIQTGPFLSVTMLTYTERIMPETIFLGLVPLYLSLIYRSTKNLHSDVSAGSSKTVLILGAICTSLKFSFLPLALAPIFLVSNWKAFRRSLLFFSASFLAFTFPLLVRMGAFNKWIAGILIHSGRHGSGPANVLDWSVMSGNMLEIWQRSPWLYIIPLMALLFLAIAYRVRFDSKQDCRKRIIKSLLVLTAMVLLQLMMIAKHYATHYLVAAQLCMPLLLLLCTQSMPLSEKTGRLFSHAAIIASIGLFLLHADSLRILPEQHLWRKELADQKTAIQQQLSKLEIPQQLIISSDDWNLRPEYALWFGKIMTPDNGKFNRYFQKEYPHVWFHKEGTGQFLQWDHTLRSASDLSPHLREAIVMVHRYDHAVKDELIASLTKIPGAEIKRSIENSSLNVSIWQLRIKSP
jgi:hypothetical protein